MNPDRAARLHDAVDDAAGEAFSYRPMAADDVNARPGADQAREAADFTGIWVAPSVESNRRPRLDMGSARQGSQRQVSAGRPVVKLQEGALPYPSAIGDRVVRLLTGEQYQVGEINGDGYGRILIGLTGRGI